MVNSWKTSNYLPIIEHKLNHLSWTNCCKNPLSNIELYGRALEWSPNVETSTKLVERVLDWFIGVFSTPECLVVVWRGTFI